MLHFFFFFGEFRSLNSLWLSIPLEYSHVTLNRCNLLHNTHKSHKKDVEFLGLEKEKKEKLSALRVRERYRFGYERRRERERDLEKWYKIL